jgi:hypothetical protein
MLKTDKSNLINTNSPRDSYVFSDGNYVIKKPVATNPAHIKVWLERQKHARDTVEKILSNRTSTSYFIPKIVEISEGPDIFVREERVAGQPLTKEMFSKLSDKQQETVYIALAQFISDMNQSSPVFDITKQLQFKNNDVLSLPDILKSLKSILTNAEITIINNAFDLLKNNVAKTPSFVFFHGDINENNIFFDTNTNTVSIIDFTEARYESAHYMFNSDLSRLPWLDIPKLIEIYNGLPKKNIVRTNQDKNTIDLFNALRTIQTTGNSLLNKPQNAVIFKKILSETIANLEKIYQRTALINTPTHSR